MRYREFKITELVALYELSDKVKKLVRDKFKKEQPTLNDQQIDFYLNRWDRYAASFPVESRDITRLTFNQVEQLIDAAEAKSQIKGRAERPQLDKTADTIYDQNDLTIIKSDTREKCVQYGNGYSWCISRPDTGNMFLHYRKQDMGPFYFVFDQSKPETDIWHAVVIYWSPAYKTYKVATSNNPGDKMMTWKEISSYQPKLRNLRSLFKADQHSPEESKFFANYGYEVSDDKYAAWSMEEKYNYIQVYKNLTPAQQDATPKELIGIAAKMSPVSVTATTWDRLNPSDRRRVRQEQLAVVTRTGWFIKLIYNPSDEMKLAAVKDDGENIRFIQNPGLDLILTAVQKTGDAIRYIKEPDLDIQLAAVRSSPTSIKYINNPDESVQIAAVTSSSSAYEHIKNPSINVQIAAVKNDQTLISYIENPSLKLQLAVVRQNPDAIRWIKNPKPAVQKLAAKLTKSTT